MKKRWSSSEKVQGLVWGFLAALAGFLVFFWVYGIRLIDVGQTGWVSAEDPSVAFFGFNFFLADEWRFPIGEIPNLNAPIGTTLVYSDSFPLISIVLKWMKSMGVGLPVPFQFAGIWILFCFVLQGACSFRVLNRETRDGLASFVGSIFFVLSPALAFRSIEATRHYSLMGHFLVILALGEWLSWARRREYRYSMWMLLLGVSLGIHFYLFAMISFLYLIPALESLIEKKMSLGNWILRQGCLAGVVVGAALLYGYGGIPASDTQGGGFGLFAMDLFSWFTSEGQALSQPFSKLHYLTQREGFQYLGLGVILGVGILFMKHRKISFEPGGLIARFPVPSGVFIFLFLLALSRRLWIFGYRLSIFITIPLVLMVFYFFMRNVKPMRTIQSLGWAFLLLLAYNLVGPLVRSSGRMGWPLTYLVVLGMVLLICSRMKRPRWVLLGLLLVQFADLIPLHAYVREKHYGFRNLGSIGVERVELARFLGAEAKRIILLVENETFQDPELNYFALRHRIPIGPVYLARHDHGARSRLLEDWRARVLRGRLEIGDVVFFGLDAKNEELLEAAKKAQPLKILPWGSGVLIQPDVRPFQADGRN